MLIQYKKLRNSPEIKARGERVHFSYNILPNPSRIEHDGVEITHVLRIPEGQMESNTMNSTSSSSFSTKTSMEVPRLSSN